MVLFVSGQDAQWHRTASIWHVNKRVPTTNACTSPVRAWRHYAVASAGLTQPQTKMFFPLKIQWEEKRRWDFLHLTLPWRLNKWKFKDRLHCTGWAILSHFTIISIPVPGLAALKWFRSPFSWSFSWAC